MKPCCQTNAKKKSNRNRRFLWTTTVISVLLFSFPFYSQVFISANAQAADSKQLKTIQLSVEGMSCQGCANNIMLALSRTNGIAKDTVVFTTKTATVTFDESKISSREIIATVDNLGFTAMTK